MKEKAVVLKIYGRVQGVGFRYYTQKKAEELGVRGRVRNRPDGSVYIEAEGAEDALNLFEKWCEEGPQWAHVTSVQKQEVPVKGYQGFEIR